jgi:hypothetical protein
VSGRVANIYGCDECGAILAECGCGGVGFVNERNDCWHDADCVACGEPIDEPCDGRMFSEQDGDPSDEAAHAKSLRDRIASRNAELSLRLKPAQTVFRPCVGCLTPQQCAASKCKVNRA